MNTEHSFGDWLRQRRRALDLTQEELAVQVGCSAITLRKLEAESRRPSKQIAERLAEVLNVPLDDRPAFLRFARGDPFAAPAKAPLDKPTLSVPEAAAPAASAPELAPSPFLDDGNTTAGPEPGDSPFKGLRYFDEADAGLFFGREALVVRLVARLIPPPGSRAPAPARFLTIVGASGSGKSSLARAGVIPALRQAGEAARYFEPIFVMTPTAHPLEALAVGLTQSAGSVMATASLMDDLARDARSLHLFGRLLLTPAARAQPSRPELDPAHLPGTRPPRLLLVIDQFEELFTLCRSESERQAFVDNLMTAVAPELDGPTTVVITLRADFYAHCAAYPPLRDALAQQQEYIGPMGVDQLRRAIELPARLGRWELEPGLVDLILHDVGAGEGRPAEPGALPLLSHALLATWQHRRGRTLTLRSYAEAGRVQGAIATTAEAVFQSLPPDEQAIARNIFVRLTELGEGTQDTRRRVALTELLPSSAATGDGAGAVAAVLKTLSDARLVTEDRDTVEVAHEALIREWPTLRQWLAQDRDGLRLRRHVTEAAQEWDELNRDPSELYRGPRLAEAIEWAEWAPHAADLNTLEREFLQASRAWAEQEAAERAAQQQRELATARRLAETERAQAETERRATLRLRTRNRIITAVGALAILIALWAALLASRNGSLAASNAASANAAQAAARVSNARELALSAINNLSVDPQLGLLLALQSVNLTYAVDHSVLPEAVGALHSAVMASHLQASLPASSAGEVLGVAFSPDDRRLATIDVEGTVTLWDVSVNARGGQFPVLFTFPGHVASKANMGWQDLAFSPDGGLLGAGAEQTANVWDVATGKLVATFNPGTAVRAIVFSPDSRRLAVDGYGESVHIYDLATRTEVGQLADWTNTESIAFSPDGTRLAVANHDQTQVWDVTSGQLQVTLPAQAGWVNNVVFSPDGSRLATAGADTTVRIWDAASGRQELLIQANANNSVEFSPDGRWLATGGNDGVARVWDAESGQELFDRLGSAQLVFGVAFSSDGARLATANSDGTAKVWDTRPDQELVTLSGATGSVFGVAFSPDGARLVTSGPGRGTQLWDSATGQALPGHFDRVDVVRSAVFSPDGKRLATASDYGIPKVVDAASGQLLLSLYGHNLGGWAVAYSPDGSRLATGSQNGVATIWDAASGAELLTLAGTNEDDAKILFIGSAGSSPGDEKVAGVAFSPDGSRIVTSNYNKVANVWDMATGQKSLSLEGHTDVVEAVAFSPDGKRIATASRDGTARVWDAVSGTALFTLAGHTTSVLSVAFSPDGSRIATGSLDDTAKVWDSATGQLLQNLPGHTAAVTGVAFSPDGSRLAVASLDGTTRLYELRLDDLIALAKTRAIRQLTQQECAQYLHGPCPAS